MAAWCACAASAPTPPLGKWAWMTGLNRARTDRLRGWAYRIRTGECVREPRSWICVTISPEVSASPSTLLPGRELNASARPSAIEAMITTRAMPEGTNKGQQKVGDDQTQQDPGIGDSDVQHNEVGLACVLRPRSRQATGHRIRTKPCLTMPSAQNRKHPTNPASA
jgi:hypothetical protein